jgi:hypothetical protein
VICAARQAGAWRIGGYERKLWQSKRAQEFRIDFIDGNI